ncbi:MAG: tyrosine-type recombinase/integrase [Cypionkella sp.]|uniref:tyrosine-type recombinase/integrase n=1 Tax=Cypionkella sp. TaxID=2811411 RepID=UPI002731E60E|nr:tyrosine-type recombinase/integrase [Cypionkella sp.]MDP2050985.1 tyrosine-type recombinase/integrase [Cypionkella sp.]
MAADLRLEDYVIRKQRGGYREYFYFRVVRDGKETRMPLPHPFSTDYRAAYDAAHQAVFGMTPNALASPTGVAELVRQHRLSEKYKRLPAASKSGRNLALDLMGERWGEFEASAIRPIHVQALYDSLSDRPATANRRLDDISSVFGWGRTRGFADVNPCRKIERVVSEGSYEPWPEADLATLIEKGRPEIVKVVLAAVYTSQRRGDVLLRLQDHTVDGGVWYLSQGKTGTAVPVPLHPVVLAIIDIERAARRKAAIVDPKRPLLTNSRGTPWTPSGFGASWTKELIRLKLRPATVAEYADGAFQPTFHGLRHTNATMIANAVARNPEIFGGIDRVKSMLGHLSERMAKHYTRRAKGEHMNAATMLLLPEIGNTPAWIGNTEAE